MEQARREHHPRRRCNVGGNVAVQFVFVKRKRIARLGQQRHVPIQLAGAGAHRWPHESITKPTTSVDDRSRAIDCFFIRTWPIEDGAIILRPDLRVTCHRLVVQAKHIGIRGEQGDADLIGEFAVAGRDQISGGGIAFDALPAMVAHDADR